VEIECSSSVGNMGVRIPAKALIVRDQFQW
jgi:hypothetical protein